MSQLNYKKYGLELEIWILELFNIVSMQSDGAELREFVLKTLKEKEADRTLNSWFDLVKCAFDHTWQNAAFDQSQNEEIDAKSRNLPAHADSCTLGLSNLEGSIPSEGELRDDSANKIFSKQRPSDQALDIIALMQFDPRNNHPIVGIPIDRLTLAALSKSPHFRRLTNYRKVVI